MIKLGILILHPHQEAEYFSQIARRARSFNIQLYKFVPASIDPATELISGEKYNPDSGAWETSRFPIPEYLYDRCFYGNDEISRKSRPIVQWLKKRPDLTFLGCGLPDKWSLYNTLKNDPILSPYVPRTERAQSASFILKRLMREKKLLLKPETGSQGKGVIRLILENNIQLATHRQKNLIKKEFTNKTSFAAWFDKLLASQNYLCQPLLEIVDDDGCVFDLRILLQKDCNGEWREQGRGLRKGEAGHVISNLSGGAEPVPYEAWFDKLPAFKQVLLEDELKTIIKNLPLLLEDAYKPLFEIGVDIGVARDGAVWVLDVNSKPGRKTIIHAVPDKQEAIYSAPLQYCTFLSKQSASLKRG